MKNFIQFGNIKIEDSTYVLLLSAIVLLAYIVPVAILQTPSGTDVYSHMFYTKIMLNSDSLYEFYDNCFERGYLGYDYPFGLWLFGSVTGKITSIDLYTISFLIPLLLIFSVVGLYYSYSGIFIDSKKYRILSMIFFLSMPNTSIGILNFSTSVFSISLILFIFYLTLNKNISYNKFIPLLISSTFILCFTHTGTYMFLLFFSVTYILIYGILCRRFDKMLFLLVLTVLFVYGITTNIFPYIHPQYIDKARLVLTVGEFLSSKLYLPLAYDLSQLFYTRAFVDKSLIDIALWSGFIYGIAKFLIFLSIQVSKLLKKILPHTPFLAIPFIGGIQNISHSVFATPFWIGPVHTFLSLIALFRLDKETLSLLISILVVTVLPGSQVTSYTGALREIHYLFLIIPITSSFGFIYIESKLKIFTNKKIFLLLISLFILGIFSSLMIMPITGNMYYKPTISGSIVEINGLEWLGEIGNPSEGCTGSGYGQMINIYGGKAVPSSTTVHSGSERKYFNKDLTGIYFFNESENYVKDMYSTFNVKYFISSDRVLRNLGGKEEKLTIYKNKELDKIYSNYDFNIYQYITPEYRISHGNITEGIIFNESYPTIDDAGADFLIETLSYKVRIRKNSPEIKYLGSKEENFLGEGEFWDYLKISWRGDPYVGITVDYVLPELNFSTTLQENKIIYKKILKDQNESENWATLIVKYTFHDTAIKTEVIIANDWLPLGLPMNLYISTITFTPFSYFTYEDWYGVKKEKRVYPSEDYSRIKNKKFSSIFFNDGDKGIFLKYDKTAPYPSDIVYQGSTQYNYSVINIDYQKYLQNGENLHITRYISIGDEDTAEGNTDKYLPVKLYPYPNGITPIILTGYLESLDHSQEKELNSTLCTYRELGDVNITGFYTEGINMREEEINKTLMNELLSYGIKIMAYENFAYEPYEPLLVQREKIRNMKNNAKEHYGIQINGFIPRYLKYSLDTIKASVDEDLLFIEALSIDLPIEEFNQEGLRYPKFAYYHGDETSLVLLPVSEPTSSYLRSEYDVENVVSAWVSIINSVVRNDDICVFLWRSNEIGKKEYIDKILDVIEYAKSKGMTFTTPEEVAEHFRLIQNISAIVSRDVDIMDISLTNENDKPIRGLTFRVIMPTIEQQCPYSVVNGKITRIKRENLNCICYVITDLSEKESKKIVIEPNITRKKFNIKIPKNPIEGKIQIFVMDENNKPLQKAFVTIENKVYKTDENGILESDLRRGIYTVKIEKAGFKTEVFELEVKGRIYSIFGFVETLG